MSKTGTALFLSVLVSGASASVGVVACSSTPAEEGETSASNLSEDELATEALKIMGAKQVQRESNDQNGCSFTGCHSINPLTLKQWKGQFDAAMEYLAGNHTREDKINYFRQNPNDPRTGFTPERMGIMAAGAHLSLGANVNPTRHPEAYAQGKALAEVFDGQDDLYKEFRKEMLMPVLPDYPRLTASQYEVILTWFKKGMPKLDEIIQENRPTTCVDNFEPLRGHAIAVKSSNWAAQNRARKLAMFACPTPDQEASPTKCFTQQREGRDVFPSSEETDFAKGWAQDRSTVRILRALTFPNSFWLRSSADGRFAATGGGQIGGAQAIDLQATLDGKDRDVGLEANYDPDFFPDNKAFMFQGGTKFCAQSLLEKPTTERVNFSEPECSSLSTASGLYQTVGQKLGDNSISDRFILYSVWAGDSGQYSATARDTQPRAGGDSAIKIYTAIALGNDVEEGYKVQGEPAEIPTPYRGDTMMARSGKIIGSRLAGETKSLGYAIESLDSMVRDGKYHFTLSPLGSVCMAGNKANFSFDERFLATHHYNEPSDYEGDDVEAYKDKGSSDVWVADFVTGRKVKVAKLNPGQFALYPHFRSDGWLYFLVVDHNTSKYYVVGSDWAVRQSEATPTP